MSGLNPGVNPFGPFVVGRVATIDLQVLEEVHDGGEGAKDISGANFSVWLRSYATRGDTGFVHDEEVAKSATRASEGYTDHAFLPTGPHASLFFELVLKDTNAPAGKQERILMWFRDTVHDAPP